MPCQDNAETCKGDIVRNGRIRLFENLAVGYCQRGFILPVFKNVSISSSFKNNCNGITVNNIPYNLYLRAVLSLPAGASVSIGVISITISEAPIRSPISPFEVIADSGMEDLMAEIISSGYSAQRGCYVPAH
jgi:hypothetical protein